jgi:hypothetical protein
LHTRHPEAAVDAEPGQKEPFKDEVWPKFPSGNVRRVLEIGV